MSGRRRVLMRHGAGTDATIAEHIAKIIDREYVFKQREGTTEYLVPSTLGIGLVKAYDSVGLENSLTKPHLRRLVGRFCAARREQKGRS